MTIKEGYKYEDGKFYNAKGEEVEAQEAVEETPTETPETTEEVEVSEEVMNSLTDTVSQIVEKEIAKATSTMKEKAVEKDIKTNKNVNVKSSYERMGKEERFKQFLIGIHTRDFGLLRDLKANEKAAGSTTSLSPLIPPTDFIAEVFRLEDEFGVARRYAQMRRTDRSSITTILGDDNIEVSIVGEGVHKPSKKLGYQPFELTFRKGVAIIPLTDELIEDSAINVWNDATARVARAYARKEDQFVFTDATSGIVNQNGVNEIFVGSSPDFDDMNDALYGVPQPSLEDGRFYFHHTWLGHFQKIKDDENNYIWRPGPNGPVDGTLWGRPYSFTQVMPSVQEADDGDNDAIAIYGNLQHTMLAERTMLKVDMSNSAIVGDPDEVDQEANTLNSWTEDLTSMRTVKRFNAKTLFPKAYSVLKLGAVS